METDNRENGPESPSDACPTLARPMERQTPPRLALSPDEAAESLGVSRDTLERHIASELRWVRRGRRKFVAVSELARWLDASAARTLE